MKNLKTMIVIVAVTALLICVAMTCAVADDRIYTSPAFRLPADQILEWAESQPEGEAPTEGTEEDGASEGVKPEEEPEEDDWGEDAREEDALDYVPEGNSSAAGTEGETPESESDAAGTEGKASEGDTPAESAEDVKPADGTGNQSEEGDTSAEPEQPKRSVMIRSSQGEVVTEGEIIYLTSKLKGFDGLDISYQWQVDRGDGAGWVNVEGANRSKHMFVADRETITYSWRLVVNILDEE